MKIEFEVPIRIESEMNRRDHWSVRYRRFNQQKFLVSGLWPKPCKRNYGKGPITVTLTRIGPRRFDDDGLSSGFKAVRDQIAEILGIDDGSDRLNWVYLQEKGKPREYKCRIAIETEKP